MSKQDVERERGVTHMGKSNKRYIAGLIIIAFGVIGLLNNFGVTAISFGYLISLLWPLLLVVAGINLITNRNLSSLITGAILLGLGVIFLGRNAGIFDIDMTNLWQAFWPVIIILIGINVLVKSDHNRGRNIAIMGAVDRTKEAWDLKSAEYTAIMGGIELDIRKANFMEREVTLNLTAIMGGINMIVPEDIAITCQGTAILGGVDILGKGSGGIVGSTNIVSGDPQNAAKILHLNCTCILGGIEIKR